MGGKPAARERTRGETRNTRLLRNGGVGSADSPEIRKDSQTEKRSSASKIETREASNDGPGLGNSQGKGHGPDRPDQSGSVGQDSKGIMHAWVGRTLGVGHGGSCGVAWVRERVGILGMAPGVARRAPSPDLLQLREAWVSCEGDEGLVNERVFSFQAR